MVRDPGSVGVAGAAIEVAGEAESPLVSKTIRTDSQGGFQFDGLRAGKYALRATELALTLDPVAVTDGATAEALFRVGSGRIVGHVVRGGLPALGTVFLNSSIPNQSRRTETERNGDFDVGGLLPGSWEVKVVATGVSHGGPGESIREGFEIAGGETVEKTLTFPYRRLIGRVLDVDGTPLVGATVRAVRSDLPAGQAFNQEEAQTSPDGRFAIIALPAGTYRVSIEEEEGADRAPVTDVVVPEEGDSAEAVLQVSP